MNCGQQRELVLPDMHLKIDSSWGVVEEDDINHAEEDEDEKGFGPAPSVLRKRETEIEGYRGEPGVVMGSAATLANLMQVKL